MNINSFIWSIADHLLHYVYDRAKYRDIILLDRSRCRCSLGEAIALARHSTPDYDGNQLC
jgi:hypothetical protein